MENIMTGKALWSFDFEVAQRDRSQDMFVHFSGWGQFHRHQGEIILNNDSLVINGDIDLFISLGTIEQIYLGFDDIFPPSLAKNFGLTWQPLRLRFAEGNSFQVVYLIIDVNIIGCKNKIWADAMVKLLE